MTHKDDGEIGESWQQPGNIADVHKLIEGWSPDIVAAVHKMKDCLDWKICYRDPLPTWVSRSGLVALTGDSAHPHLPTSAQGASQATEDGAVLALCLTLAGNGNVPLATRTYERLRYDRVRKAQLCGEDLRDRWHNALKQVNEGEEIDPESLHMRVIPVSCLGAHDRMRGYTHMTQKRILLKDGPKFRRKLQKRWRKERIGRTNSLTNPLK
jgi:salicylate hydroxylase